MRNFDKIQSLSIEQYAELTKCTSSGGERCFKECEDCYGERLTYLKQEYNPNELIWRLTK